MCAAPSAKDQLVLLSDRPEDLKFFQPLCEAEGSFVLHRTMNIEEMRTIVSSNPQTVVVWDAQNVALYNTVHNWIGKYIRPNRFFACTQESLANHVQHMKKFSIVGNHITRHYSPVTMDVYRKILKATLDEEAFGVKRYVPAESKIRTINIKQSNHKSAAIEAIQNVLSGQGVKNRVAALVAQSTDELILNAIFNAPVDREGKRYKQYVPKDSELELDQDHEIQVAMATAEHYMAICVRDQFGSLPRERIIDAFAGKKIQTGLSRTLQGGISILFICKPKVRTEVMLFFRLTDNYKDFKKSFHFLGTVIYLT